MLSSSFPRLWLSFLLCVLLEVPQKFHCGSIQETEVQCRHIDFSWGTVDRAQFSKMRQTQKISTPKPLHFFVCRDPSWIQLNCFFRLWKISSSYMNAVAWEADKNLVLKYLSVLWSWGETPFSIVRGSSFNWYLTLYNKPLCAPSGWWTCVCTFMPEYNNVLRWHWFQPCIVLHVDSSVFR